MRFANAKRKTNHILNDIVMGRRYLPKFRHARAKKTSKESGLQCRIVLIHHPSPNDREGSHSQRGSYELTNDDRYFSEHNAIPFLPPSAIQVSQTALLFPLLLANWLWLVREQPMAVEAYRHG